MPPLVSVIIPTFNSERWLRETIESVQAQTVPDWEIIVSDDGSTDGTVELARSLADADPRIRVIQNEPAHHPGATRNAGVRCAQGKYLAFLDSDDLWLPRKLEVQLEVIGRIEKPGVCYTRAVGFQAEAVRHAEQERQACAESNARFRNMASLRRATPGYLTPPPRNREDQYRWMLLTCNQACTISWLMEREFFEEVGGFTEHPALTVGEDWDFILRAIRLRPLIFIDQTLVQYRLRPDSITARRHGSWEYRFELYRQVEQRGQMPAKLKNKCHSVAWLTRGESELNNDEPGWRGSFIKALAFDPFNWRRWPLALVCPLPAPWARRMYNGLKAIQHRLAGTRRGDTKNTEKKNF